MRIEPERHLNGKLLIAMPGMGDPRFERAVIYMCSHSDEGAMGLVVNRRAPGVSFGELMAQLEIEVGPQAQLADVHVGGPVETARGFVLHSSDFHIDDSTMRVDEGISLTATLEVLRAMAAGSGPRKALIALGYSGWAPSQLEGELQRNGWLTCEADEEILFSRDDAMKWERALAKLGVSPAALSATGGTA
ncbi:MAG: YqgE/AlgH family protein [Rubrimonas sp.]|uniref:YqgE/AlgH family protein n=1 Tax=Rubrimonas sp. TaxID=2036015 RepID=UPI002FDEC507